MGGYNKMTKEQVRKWMYAGRELEFESGGKQYSLSPIRKRRWEDVDLLL